MLDNTSDLEQAARELRVRWKGADKIAICGVGSLLRSDDAAGIRTLGHLLRLGVSGDRVLLIECGQIPEDYMNRLVDAKVDHVTVLDAAQLNQPPGSVRLIEADEIDRAATSTHALPLSFFAGYLVQHGIKTSFLGIQPASLDVGEAMSPELEKAVQEVAHIVAGVLRELGLVQ